MRLPGLLLVATLTVLGGCRTITAEDRRVIAAYLENAAQYYDGGHYPNALQQWGKALELDPDEEKARLGQAMALYRMGLEDTKEGLGNLAEAERRLAALRGGELGDQSWKAEIGYALVQMRWAEAYDRVVRVQEAHAAAGRPHDPAKAAQARAERPRRIAAAEQSFRTVLADPRVEPNFQLTCWIGLAKMTALRGAYEESLAWCGKYEEQVVRSREFWAKRGPTYETKLLGAEMQEAELRDVLANTLFKLGRFEQAEEQLDRLVAVQPARASAYLNRGMLREARGAWDLARSDYGNFLRLTDLGSDDPTVLEAEKRRFLCEERLAAEDARLQPEAPRPR
jgi:tetratricopeptide (TPR) repeat protein